MTTTEQETAMQIQPPTPEHQWLQKLVGEWTYECKAGSPEHGEAAWGGTEVVRAFGDFWVVGESQGPMPGGGDMTMVITLGYDPQRERFVGTWVASAMPTLWVYEGQLDESGRVLTLECDGPDMMNPGQTRRYRDVIELESDDRRLFSGTMLGDDGEWLIHMTTTYLRKR